MIVKNNKKTQSNNIIQLNNLVSANRKFMEGIETTLSSFETNDNNSQSSTDNQAEVITDHSTETANSAEGNQESTQAATDTVEQEENTVPFSINLGDEPAPATSVEQKSQPASIPWQDAIKGVDKKELAKAIGLNDFVLELDEHLSRGGQAADYLTAKAIDYTKISDEDLIKSDLAKEMPNATAAQLNLWIQRNYNQGELAEEEDKEFGLMKMQRDANAIRQARIAEQKNFKLPESIAPKVDTEAQKALAEAQRQQQEALDRHYQFILNDEATKALMDSKRVSIPLGEGVKPFNVPIDRPELLMKVINDSETWNKVLHNEKGEPKVALMQKLALVALDPDYEKKIYNAGLMAAKQKIVSENQNIKKPDGGTIVNMSTQGVRYVGETTLGALNQQ